MEQDRSLAEYIEDVFSVVRQNSNLQDVKTVAHFMILIDKIIESHQEITKLNYSGQSKLALISSVLITSGFTNSHPQYYNYSTGEVVSAIGFYAFMQQLESGEFRNSHFPAFIVLLHDGRKYLAEILEACILSNGSPYNPLFMSEYNYIESKKTAIIKRFELMIHSYCKKIGIADEHLNHWENELINDYKTQEVAGDVAAEYSKKLYKYIESKLKTDTPFDFSR